MQLRNKLLAAQGTFCLLALALTPCKSAFAMQPVLGEQEQQAVSSQDTQPDKQAAKDVVVTGTIVKSGSTFVLRDSSGAVYKLDAQDKAGPFEGKTVKITGKLDAAAKLLHIEAIEAISA